MAKILIVEDDNVIADGMARHLAAAGFDPIVVGRGELGLTRLRYENPDVCVLDLMLPELDGWKLIETARAEGIGTPIVVVSARGTEHDRVHALEIGADDYLVKPFSMRELVARVGAAARRGVRPAEERRGDPIEIEELRIDPREVQAFVDGKSVGLTPTEFRLLYTLALDRGRVVTRDELLQKVWGRRETHRDRTVDVFVRRLRQKIDRDAPKHSFIQTRFGVGYKLEPLAQVAARVGSTLPVVEFELRPEQREIQALTREFARAEIDPHAAEWDREHRFPSDVFAKLAGLGLMGVCVPEASGGAGADFVSYALVLEELSRADAGVGVTVAVHTSAATLPLLAFGTEEQRERYVPPLARGELLGAFALTESGAGSDAGRARHARRARGRRLAHHGREAMDHERLLRRHVPRLRPHRSGDGERARRLGVRARRGARRGDARGGEARPQLVVDRRSDDRRGGSRGSPARRAAPRLPGRDVDARRRPDRDRRAGGRDRARRVRGRARLREGANGVRPQDRPVPGDPAQAREHVDGDRRRPAAHAAGGVAEGSGAGR